MSGEVIGPSGETTAIVLLDGHNVPVKLPPKNLCLCPQITVVSWSRRETSFTSDGVP